MVWFNKNYKHHIFYLIRGELLEYNKNDILSMNAFYAKQIACKIVRYAFVNNLSLVSNGETIDCWDFLYEQITNGQYYTSPTLTYNNYKSFMVDFLDFCENITYEQFKSSSIMENIIY